MGRGRKRGGSTPVWFRRLVLVGALATTFVVGVLVGQHSPRPIAEYFVAPVLDEPEDHERMAAPSADRVLTFYDSLPQPADAGGEAGEEPSTRVLARAPEPPAATEPPATARTLGRQAVESERAVEEAPASARTLSRTAGNEPSADAVAEAVSSGEGTGEREQAPSAASVPPAEQPVVERGTSAEAPAPASGEAARENAPESSAPAPPSRETRSLARAPVQAGNALEGEVASAGSWEEAQEIRRRLSEAGVETAVITVEEPGQGRRVAVLVRPGSDTASRVLEARSILASR